MFRRLRRWRLRLKAKRLYLEYQMELEGYTGAAVAERIDPRLAGLRRRYELIIELLKADEGRT
jgi:hypothetical protein